MVLVHGMGEDARRWAGVVEALAGEARVIVYDRRAYGDSPVPEPYGGTTAAEQGEDLVRVIREHHAAPAVLGGQDVGGLACLYVILRHPELVRGAVLVAPPVFALVSTASDELTAERIALGEKLHEVGPQGAMEAYLGHPSDVPPRAFFADWAGLASLPLSRRELRTVSVPVTVLPGDDTPPHVSLAASALARALGAGSEAPGGDPVPALRAMLA